MYSSVATGMGGPGYALTATQAVSM
eukprot:SAG22_NODE_21951_length_252_cov_1.346405_1_plen_24_part_10